MPLLSRYSRALLLITVLLASVTAPAAQKDISPPVSASVISSAFGTAVTVLPNGNFVVIDYKATVSGASQAGAVFLYHPDGSLISTLTGSQANDHVGKDGIVVVGNSNFVVMSTQWNNGAAAYAGAATWVDGVLGLNNAVKPTNSLVGSTAGDSVGIVGALSNGDYIADSWLWSNGATAGVGAITWGSGNSGVSGPLTSGNSLMGVAAGDAVGNGGAVFLTNGNYVVLSLDWNGGKGAITWMDGSAASVGQVTDANSMVGSVSGVNADHVGNGNTIALPNGNYVVASYSWNGDRGAVTWGSGSYGLVGTVSSENSLVGTTAGDEVGSLGFTALTSGHFVVASPNWHNGTSKVGAATWGLGTVAITGTISSGNSLVGALDGDQVSSYRVLALTNGNYVVLSPSWNYNAFALEVGAATWCNGDGSTKGLVGPANSLVGTTQYDSVGLHAVALTNGNYIVLSPHWSYPLEATNVGAVTWCDGTNNSCAGTYVLPASITGYTQNDMVGGDNAFGASAVALSNGNYAFVSPSWNNGATSGVGAVTWADGTVASGVPVSQANSLTGTQQYDYVGNDSITALGNGNYVVVSSAWMDTGVAGGAVTMLRGDRAHPGVVSEFNSFIGTHFNDQVGNPTIAPMSDGNYVIVSNGWNDVYGAVTLASSNYRLIGTVAPWNSVIGGISGEGLAMVFGYDPKRHQLVVGRPLENLVSLFTMDEIFADNLEP